MDCNRRLYGVFRGKQQWQVEILPEISFVSFQQCNCFDDVKVARRYISCKPDSNGYQDAQKYG